MNIKKNNIYNFHFSVKTFEHYSDSRVLISDTNEPEETYLVFAKTLDEAKIEFNKVKERYLNNHIFGTKNGVNYSTTNKVKLIKISEFKKVNEYKEI